jgi:dienelactone hydrolase
VETFIADARAAVDALARQPGVDGHTLVAIGHSQGAGFVPVLLDGDPRLVAGVLLAAAHDPPDIAVAAQAQRTHELLDSLGTPPDQAQAATAPLDRAAADLAAIRRGGEVPAEPILGASASFWRSWIDQADTVPQLAARLTRPLLVLSGELDWNAPPDQAAAWEQTLAPATSNHQVVVLPCVTHALNCVTESDPAVIEPGDLGTHVAPEVVDTITTFLNDQT